MSTKKNAVAALFIYSFSTTRSFALRDAGLARRSSSAAVTGLRVRISSSRRPPH